MMMTSASIRYLPTSRFASLPPTYSSSPSCGRELANAPIASKLADGKTGRTSKQRRIKLSGMENLAGSPIKPIKSLLYWRKGKINGAKTVPIVLTLDRFGVVTMKTADQETIFSLPANEAAVRFTSWGTMVIGVQGNSYDIVGLGASTSPKPSKAQLEELSAPFGTNAGTGTGPSRAGSTGVALSGAGDLGALAGVAGSVAMQFAYYQGLEAIKAWQATLPRAGAAVTKSSMKAMKYITAAIIACVVIGLAIGLLNK
jgi:hypothetical protein